MNLETLHLGARNLRNFLVFNLNARMGREFIPAQRDLLCVETCSACNLDCRFCGYGKKQSPRVRMADDVFFDCIDQAVEMGFRRFQLTPLTGDVFMDSHLFAKLEFLENHAGVGSYEFFTNFTIPNDQKIEHLFSLNKLTNLVVSIYGHDQRSFMAITRSEPKVYQRLLANLESLYRRLDRRRFYLELGMRSYRRLPRSASSELLMMLDRFTAAGISITRSRRYNNWGGYVTNADVKGLDIEITSADAVYKKGVCTLMFTDVQVMATGIVNACACRDVDATLCIGNIRDQPLREILSSRNQAWMELIHEQQEGRFRPVCRSCDFYKSIYRNRSSNKKSGKASLTLRQFLETLDL